MILKDYPSSALDIKLDDTGQNPEVALPGVQVRRVWDFSLKEDLVELIILYSKTDQILARR
jgi:hypothetical protein